MNNLLFTKPIVKTRNLLNSVILLDIGTILLDMGAPVCALCLLCSYLENRRMEMHMNGVVSSVYELWGGGPQGGLLTVLLFNVNGNWLTDVCQPGFPQEHRFLKRTGPVCVPRTAVEQMRDCPPAVLPKMRTAV